MKHILSQKGLNESNSKFKMEEISIRDPRDYSPEELITFIRDCYSARNKHLGISNYPKQPISSDDILSGRVSNEKVLDSFCEYSKTNMDYGLGKYLTEKSRIIIADYIIWHTYNHYK